MKSIDVLYFIEHVSRELDTACIVKYLCKKKYGLSVKIASLPFEVDSVIHQYQPHIVALPYLYSSKSTKIPPIIKHWKNLTYLNLNYEQFFSNINRKFKAPQDSFVRNEVYQIAWSKSFKDYLVNNGVEESHIFITGNPSYILYKKPYCKYFPTRSALANKHRLNPQKIWLFFPENYGWAFKTDKEIKLTYINLGYDIKVAYKNRTFNQKSLKKVIHWFNCIAQDQKLEIIVRPRPAISQIAYFKQFQRELGRIPESIHIIKDGSIREWNLACDILVSSFSTSLLEAAVAKKPVYILEPYPFPEWLYTDWFDLVPHIKSLKELEYICIHNPDSTSSQRAEDYVLQTNLSGGDAIANIAQTLYNLHKKRKSPATYIPLQKELSPIAEKFPNEKQSIETIVKKPLKILKTEIKWLLSNNKSETEDIEDPFFDDHFTEKDIEERIKKWEEVLTT